MPVRQEVLEVDRLHLAGPVINLYTAKNSHLINFKAPLIWKNVLFICNSFGSLTFVKQRCSKNLHKDEVINVQFIIYKLFDIKFRLFFSFY